MKGKMKKISVTILGVLSALFLSLGVWGNSFTSKAEEITLIPTGYTVAPYHVKDIETPISTVTTGWSGTGEQNFTLDGASVVRFTLTHTGGNFGWVSLALFANTSYSTDSEKGMVVFKMYKEKSSGNSASYAVYQTNNLNVLATSDFEQPEGLSFTANSSYQIEIGGVDVLDGSGNVFGKIFYLEIDGTRVVEKYLETSISFTCDKFAYNIWSENVTFSAITTETTDISETANVSFAKESYDCAAGPATPTPLVTVNKTVNGIAYPQIIDDKYYDVAYTNNTVAGTATATVTFKGIYGGTASGNFTVVKTERIIPKGYTVAPYKVLDLETKTLSGASLVSTKVAIGEEKAVRFKMTMTAGSVWGTVFGMNCAESNYYTSLGEGRACYYFYINNNTVLGPNIKFTIVTNGTQILVDGKVYELSSALMGKLTTDGSTLNVEVGGVDVMGTDNVKSGTLIYLEVDGDRVAEYYYDTYATLPFTGGYFQFECNSTAVTLETVSGVTDLTDKASVTFAKESYDCAMSPATPTPVVTATKTVGVNDLAVDYTEIINEKYYDVAYVNNTVAGTATATVTFKGIYGGTASGNFTVVEIFEVKYASLSLNGDIGLNFYAKLSSNETAPKANIGLADGTKTLCDGTYVEELALWKFSGSVAPKDYKKTVSFALTTYDGTEVTAEYSVETYLNNVTESEPHYELCVKTKEYCEAARVYFNGETATETETLSADLSDYAGSVSGEDGNVTILGATLVLETKTSVRVYFKAENAEGPVCTIDGNTAEIKEENGFTYLELADIAVKDLGGMHEFAIGGITVNYGAISYVKSVANVTDNVALDNVMKALYNAFVAGADYFNAN